MKKLLLVALLCLGGCASFGEKQLVDQPTVVKYKYVVVVIPDEMLAIPEPERKLDTNVATDKDAAKWMTDWEKRYQEIEKRLQTIRSYQERRLKELNLPPADVIKN